MDAGPSSKQNCIKIELNPYKPLSTLSFGFGCIPI